MNRRKKIFRNQSGETIIEVIVSIGIVLIALFAFSTCVVTSGKINAQVAEQDKNLYANIARVQKRLKTDIQENPDDTDSPTIIIKGLGSDIELKITIYEAKGNEDENGNGVGELKSFSLYKEETTP